MFIKLFLIENVSFAIIAAYLADMPAFLTGLFMFLSTMNTKS
jgi:hypothetical protein